MASVDEGLVTLRAAKEEDCEEIYKLMQDCLEYLGIADWCHSTINDFRRDGFSSQPWFHCIVAEFCSPEGRHIVGFVIYFFTYGVCDGRCVYIEALCISEDYRNKGIGTRILQKLSQIVLDNGCKRIGLTVFGGNSRLRAYYEKLGFQNFTSNKNLMIYRLLEPNITNLVSSS